jgi:hypothetical protein
MQRLESNGIRLSSQDIEINNEIALNRKICRTIAPPGGGNYIGRAQAAAQARANHPSAPTVNMPCPHLLPEAFSLHERGACGEAVRILVERA